MTGFDIYLFTRLDAIRDFLIFPLVIFLMSLTASGIMWIIAITADEEEEKYCGIGKKLTKLSASIVLLASLMLTFIPSTKEYAAIYLIPKVVNNEQVQQVPENALKLLNAKLQEWLKDINKEGDKK
jgi:cytochrome bd-type quinol oxidase subunit 2